MARRLRHAMVCSSNNNRSMEAHSLFKRQGLDVFSYGTGSQVKLPGPSIREPNVYDFGTPYRHMYDDLRRKDPDLYPTDSLLPILKPLSKPILESVVTTDWLFSVPFMVSCVFLMFLFWLV